MLKVNLYPRKTRKLKLQTFLILLGSLMIAGFSLNYLFSTYLYLMQSSMMRKEFPTIARLGIGVSGNVSKTLEDVKMRDKQLKLENQRIKKELDKAVDFLKTEWREHDYFSMISEFSKRFNGGKYVLKSLVYSPDRMELSLWELTEGEPMAEKLLKSLAADYGLVFTRKAYDQYSLGGLKVVELSVSFENKKR